MSTTDETTDLYAGSADTAEGKVFTVTGQDWDSITQGLEAQATRQRNASSSTWARSTPRPTACSG